ncbi:MAG: hypothetical protein RR351_06525 [Christensenella sp.]
MMNKAAMKPGYLDWFLRGWGSAYNYFESKDGRRAMQSEIFEKQQRARMIATVLAVAVTITLMCAVQLKKDMAWMNSLLLIVFEGVLFVLQYVVYRCYAHYEEVELDTGLSKKVQHIKKVNSIAWIGLLIFALGASMVMLLMK